MQILCGDIGGTNSRLLVADVDGANITTIVEKHYRSQTFKHFDDVMDTFLQEVKTVPDSACFAVAGPIKYGKAKITNLPWQLNESTLQEKYSFAHVSLINDFSAVAYGVNALQEPDLKTIQYGSHETYAPKIILGAGTGLGVAQSVYCNGQWQVMPSQGGHMAFSPTNASQRDILQWMSIQQDYVSNEDMLSGKGLVNLYRYYAAISNQLDSSWVKQILALADPAAAISQRAITGKDEIAAEALARFIEIYAALAGDLALLALAYGGVFLAGGIAPKIAGQLCNDTFLKCFYQKGPMAELMPQFPVRIIMNERVGLLGAAIYATHSVQNSYKT